MVSVITKKMLTLATATYKMDLNRNYTKLGYRKLNLEDGNSAFCLGAKVLSSKMQ
jgi:hypothetical protein